ncbi:Filament-forming protein [Coemansia interrupta]|uniref:Filament-forming protein n=1 Tax=Coemansia interrupta TaxID=1126814 RepID=A0A9W8H1Q2_9FUNG|nr:Filament-forming protein [Coemansia interrupta]
MSGVPAAAAAADDDSGEQAKAQLQYENTRLVHRLTRQVGQLKSALEGANSEARAAKSQAESTQGQLSELQRQSDLQTSQAQAHEQTIARLTSELDQMRDDKRQLLAQVGERRAEVDSRSTEIQRLTELLQDAETARASEHAELMRLRAQSTAGEVGEHMLRQAADRAREQTEWLDGELTKAQAELQKARTEMARATAGGRAEAARLQGEVDALGEENGELKERVKKLERTLRTRSEEARVARQQMAEMKEQFRGEMGAQKALCDEWERTAEAAKEHVRGVERSLRALEQQTSEAERTAQEAVDQAEERAAEAEKEAEALGDHARELEQKLAQANALLADMAQAEVAGATALSPTADAAAKLRQRGAGKTLSITQLYADKVALEDRVRQAEREAAVLREAMEQILAEIEERAPALAQERAEHEQLLADADRIAGELAELRRKYAAQTRELGETRRARELAERQLAAERQQTEDLERQLAGVLRGAEEARRETGAMAEARDDAVAVVPETADDVARLDEVERVISQNLVVFADIRQLVAQNRRLLRTTRELAKQVVQEEEDRRARADEETKEALGQAEEMLDRLAIELEGARKRVGLVERERDMLRAAAGDPAPEEAESPADASEENPDEEDNATEESDDLARPPELDHDAYVREARATRAQQDQVIAQLQSEASDLRVRAARAEAQSQFDADRIAMLTADIAARTRETEHLRTATARLHAQGAAYEKQIDALTRTADAERVELARLQRQTAMLEAETAELRQAEQRWRAEETRAAAERASLGQILENATRMRSDAQRQAEQQAEVMRERLDEARAQCDAVKAELRDARDAGERDRHAFDVEMREMRAQLAAREERVEKAQEKAQEARDTLNQAVQAQKAAEEKAEALQAQVDRLEEQVRAHDELAERALRNSGAAEGPVPNEALLAEQLRDARAQLDALRAELDATRERSETFRVLAQDNDRALAELTEAYDAYKVDAERKETARSARAAVLERQAKESAEALSACQKSLEAAETRAREALAASAAQQTDYETRIAALSLDVEQKTKKVQAQAESLRARDEAYRSLQEQYEKEVVLHAEAIQKSLRMREQLVNTKRLLAQATGELQACQQAVARLELQRDEVRKAAQKEVEKTAEQLAGVRRQNAVLLAHLEALGRDVPDVQVDPEVAAEGAEAEASTGLRDVVVYLRRERDLAAAQLEVAQQESQRWRQQATHTQQMLDDVRGELMQYVPESQSQSTSTASGQPEPSDLVPPGSGPLTLTAAQREMCRRQLEQAAILRESNGVLRSDLKAARTQLGRSEAEVRSLRDQEVPRLRQNNAELTAQLEASRAHVAQLTEMCESWKRRHESLVDKYKMIEPEEHEALKLRVGELEKERAELVDKVERAAVESRELLDKVERVTREKQEALKRAEQVERQRGSADAQRTRVLQSEVARLKQQAEEAEKLAAELRQKLGEQEQAVAQASKEAMASKAKYDKLHAVFQKLRAQSVEKLDQSAAAIKAHEATILALQQQLETAGGGSGADAEAAGRLQAEIAALTKDKDEAVEAQRKMASDLEDTRAALEQARAQLAAAAASSSSSSAEQPSGGAESGDTTSLQAALSAAEAKVRSYEAQLEEIKARALKYARDNKTLQTRLAELQKQMDASSGAAGSEEVEQLRKQLAEMEARVEQVRASAKSSAELRAKLQVSQANKRVEEMQKKVEELQQAASLKRSAEASAAQDGPAKKPHVEE